MDWILNFLASFNTKAIFESIQRRKEAEKNAKEGEPVEPPTYGFEFYPERRGARETPTLKEVVTQFKGTEDLKRMKCEKAIYQLLKENDLVRILIGALEKAGCPVDIRRHFSCEICDLRISGGYDPELNQIVVCQNTSKSKWEPALIHELVHMYDFCVNKVDFKNLDHLACTEIRAANLTHCSFLSSMFLGESSPINIKQTHQYCVKLKAAQSVMVSRTVDWETAFDAVYRVFNRCYNDLEPFGRRMKRGSGDPKLAYKEAVYYGYCDGY